MVVQTKTKKINFYIALFLNVAIVVMEIVGLLKSYNRQKFESLKFYTEDSNILGFITSLIFCIASIKAIVVKDFSISKWVKVLRYMATSCLTVTFVVVLTVLSPAGGLKALEEMMLKDSMLYHHFLCPVVAFISFVFFEQSLGFNKKTTLFALIPTLVYAVISTTLNILRLLDGPYPFLKVYEQSPLMSVIWFIVICGGAWLFALLILKLNSRKER